MLWYVLCLNDLVLLVFGYFSHSRSPYIRDMWFRSCNMIFCNVFMYYNMCKCNLFFLCYIFSDTCDCIRPKWSDRVGGLVHINWHKLSISCISVEYIALYMLKLIDYFHFWDGFSHSSFTWMCKFAYCSYIRVRLIYYVLRLVAISGPHISVTRDRINMIWLTCVSLLQ